MIGGESPAFGESLTPVFLTTGVKGSPTSRKVQGISWLSKTIYSPNINIPLAQI